MAGGLYAGGAGPCDAGPCVPVSSIYFLVVVVAGCGTKDATTMLRAGSSQVGLLPHRHREDGTEDDDWGEGNERLGL